MIHVTAQIEMLSNLTHIAFLRTAQKYYPCAFIGHGCNTQADSLELPNNDKTIHFPVLP